MPHAANDDSLSSFASFTLDVGDEQFFDRPMSAGADSQRTKRASSTYGVALTSTPSQDERSALPSQQKPNDWKRKSAPGSEYADLITSQSFNFDDLKHRGAGERNSVHSTLYNDAAKRRSQIFDEQVSYKDSVMSQSREKIVRQSPVIAELKTNVIIKDEFTLVTDLSAHLASRYQRADTSIMIRVDHSACLALGGNFDPCYILTISAIQSQMGPSTNKRNAAMIQKFMADILSVPSERGVVTFVPLAEENIAIGGSTMLSEIERQEKRNSVIADPNGLKSAIKDASRRSMTFPNKSNQKLNGDYRSNGNLTATTTSSPSITPPPPSQISDKAQSSTDKDGRPSTAHGGFDGLRMNGISNEMLTGNNARLPNGRPRTFGGTTQTSVQDSLKAEPLPHVSRQSAQQAQRVSMQKASASKRNSTTAHTTPKSNSLLVPRPVQAPRSATTATSAPAPATRSKSTTPTPASTELRTKNTYLDNISSLTKKNHSTTKVDDSYDDEDDIPLAKTAAGRANTAAKRRSTITATPSLPPTTKKDKSQGPLKPPPIPDDSKSMSSRLSKRKSFLRMFKRQSVPAWYEQ